MTFDAIVADVADRLNQTSAESLTRIGGFVNNRYRKVLRDCGMQLSTRTTVTAAATIGDRYMVFEDTRKILAVFDESQTPARVLGERSFQWLRNQTVRTSEPVWEYAIARMGAHDVTIFLDCVPTTEFELTVDCYSRTSVMADDDEPSFDEDFHDILIDGAKADELRKMEKPELAAESEALYMQGIADLKFFNAKSAYLNIVAGSRRGRIAPVRMV